MKLDPALVLGILVGIGNAALWVVIRGTGGGRLPLILVASILGAWAGNTLGDRLGLTIGSIGDFRVLAATVGAWIGIGVVSVVAVLGPSARRS